MSPQHLTISCTADEQHCRIDSIITSSLFIDISYSDGWGQFVPGTIGGSNLSAQISILYVW